MSFSLLLPRRQVDDGSWWRPRSSRTRSTTWTSSVLTVPTPGPSLAPTSPVPPSPPLQTASDESSTQSTIRSGFWTVVPAPTYPPGPSPTPSSAPTPPGSDSVTDSTSMPTDTTPTVLPPFPTTTRSSETSGTDPSNDVSGIRSNRTLVITLSSVLSVVGLLLVAGAILICWRYRRHRKPFFARGISPIDDDEIATWKVPRSEKAAMMAGETDVEAEGATAAPAAAAEGSPSHVRHTSTGSVKKPPSVIVYSNAHGQGGHGKSEDEGSPRSFAQSAQSAYSPYCGKSSLDKALPQTPIQARAPNSRAGLTDESIPGDDPFIPSPKRQPSRLSKIPPSFSSQRRAHTRARSSRSSTHSFGGYGYAGSDVGLSPRHSHDNYTSTNTHRNHSRVYSSSSIPPRLSFGNEDPVSGLSPRPMFRDDEIGRAIG